MLEKESLPTLFRTISTTAELYIHWETLWCSVAAGKNTPQQKDGDNVHTKWLNGGNKNKLQELPPQKEGGQYSTHH